MNYNINPETPLEVNNVLADGLCKMPIRVQRKQAKGYKMPINTKSVTRPHKFGNPYKIGMNNVWDIKDRETGKSLKDILIAKNGENKYHTVEDTLLAFCEKIKASAAMQRVIKRELFGKNLACFCPISSPCHADILLEVANKSFTNLKIKTP
jgi:hypothetical protein